MLGSTWGRAGRRFLRMIFLTLRSGAVVTSEEVVVRAVEGSSEEACSGCASAAGGACSTSAIVEVVGGWRCLWFGLVALWSEIMMSGPRILQG